jgi:hypothetical protein
MVRTYASRVRRYEASCEELGAPVRLAAESTEAFDRGEVALNLEEQT